MSAFTAATLMVGCGGKGDKSKQTPSAARIDINMSLVFTQNELLTQELIKVTGSGKHELKALFFDAIMFCLVRNETKRDGFSNDRGAKMHKKSCVRRPGLWTNRGPS